MSKLTLLLFINSRLFFNIFSRIITVETWLEAFSRDINKLLIKKKNVSNSLSTVELKSYSFLMVSNFVLLAELKTLICNYSQVINDIANL